MDIIKDRTIEVLVAIDDRIRAFVKGLPKSFTFGEMGMYLYRGIAVKTLKETAKNLRKLINYRNKRRKLKDNLLPLIKGLHRLWLRFKEVGSIYIETLSEFLVELESLLPGETAIQYDLFDQEEIEPPFWKKDIVSEFQIWRRQRIRIERESVSYEPAPQPAKQLSLRLW